METDLIYEDWIILEKLFWSKQCVKKTSLQKSRRASHLTSCIQMWKSDEVDAVNALLSDQSRVSPPLPPPPSSSFSFVHWNVNVNVLVFWFVSFIRPTPGDTPTHNPHERFFIRELRQIEIVFSLKSRPRADNYLRTLGFSECPCFFIYTCLHSRASCAARKHDETRAVSHPPTCHLPLRQSHGQIFLSVWKDRCAIIKQNGCHWKRNSSTLLLS